MENGKHNRLKSVKTNLIMTQSCLTDEKFTQNEYDNTGEKIACIYTSKERSLSLVHFSIFHEIPSAKIIL